LRVRVELLRTGEGGDRQGPVVDGYRGSLSERVTVGESSDTSN
jgi:hypothetical protein